jgi:ATP-binding cassette subfamily B protein
MLLTQVFQGLTSWVRTAQSELVQDHIKALIHEQAATVDLEFYETPAYFDQMSRANSQADSRSMSILQSLGALIQHSATLIAISGLLIPYSIWLPLILLLSTLPALFVVMRHNKYYHTWWRGLTEKRRWLDYFDQLLALRLAAPEIRIFNLNKYLQNEYMTLRKWLREERLGLMRRQVVATFGAGVTALLVTIATLAWMVWRSMNGQATLGDLALFYQAFNQGQSLLRTLLNSVGQLYTDALFLEHLFAFLESEPKVMNPANPKPVPDRLRKGIEIENVSFSYPASAALALKDFSLSIPANKIVAIVGPNGAGKSTLIKLICRFYDPRAGRVTFDGVDIREMNVTELWKRITVMFQYPNNYLGKIGESIRMGDIHAPDDGTTRLDAATEAGGAREIIDELPLGYDTLMGKQFEGGLDLSGGQWQRIALARAFYRQAPLVILDEPTSFMDSWAENEWLDRFCKLVQDRTALIVTHRFTTAMRADLIYVMDRGRVVEFGSHGELLEQNGLYATSWRSQIRAGNIGRVIE